MAGRRRAKRIAVAALASLSLVGGLGVGAATMIAPDQVAQTYGGVQSAVGQWRISVAREVPTARLGAAGGREVLSRCDGTFTHMLTYKGTGVPAVWAAHNNCGGDVVLPLDVGDQIDVVKKGVTTRYEVVEVRKTPKVWASTERLAGMKGEFALQSCYYGGTEVPMKFVGLEPVSSKPDTVTVG